VDKNVDNFFVKYKFEFVTDLWELILEQWISVNPVVTIIWITGKVKKIYNFCDRSQPQPTWSNGGVSPCDYTNVCACNDHDRNSKCKSTKSCVQWPWYKLFCVKSNLLFWLRRIELKMKVFFF
jgi:hypothetical protein